jgi:hypothetical protein
MQPSIFYFLSGNLIDLGFLTTFVVNIRNLKLHYCISLHGRVGKSFAFKSLGPSSILGDRIIFLQIIAFLPFALLTLIFYVAILNRQGYINLSLLLG